MQATGLIWLEVNVALLHLAHGVAPGWGSLLRRTPTQGWGGLSLTHPVPRTPPAHEAGLVALQVARDSRPVSTSVLFEYRARNFLALPSTQVDWLSLDGECWGGYWVSAGGWVLG